MKEVSTKTTYNQEIEDKNKLKDIFCYLSIAILPFFLFSYRFLPKIETIKILGYDWDFNGFPNSYSFLFAFISKIVPILFISIFFLNPRPINLFNKEISFKTFLIPTIILYCYQLIFIIAPVDKIDEGFYTELVGWSCALLMTLIVVFSNELFNLINNLFTFLFIKTTLQSKRLKFKVRELISFILAVRESKSHSIDKEKFDKEMWNIFEKISK
ncbi:hypothetical protein [Tenacibaculum amylolyticum]|uniref:hypothetical protein n=1 Tax=Tenacibaculum amylolyticum TaxID=104269 RepID=UPI0038946526